MSETVYRRNIDLLEADVGDELVALDPDQGNCFGFNSVATSVWQQLKDPRTIEQLKAHLLSKYVVSDVECEEGLRALLQDFEAKGLVVRN